MNEIQICPQYMLIFEVIYEVCTFMARCLMIPGDKVIS